MKKNVIVAMLVALCAAAWATTPEELLLHAVKTVNMNELQIALEQGAYPNYTDASGKSVLIYACEKEWYGGVVRLLENRANVEIRNKADGKTALMYAVQGANTMIVQKLIEEMANVNVKDFEGKTALMYAIESRNDQVIDFLLRRGADCLATDNYGNNVAMYVVKHNNNNRTLLRKFVRNPLIDWNETNNEGISPFALACMDGDLNTVRQILQETPIGISDSRIDGQPILIWLIAHNKSRITIEYIIRFCALEEIHSMIDEAGHDIKYWAEKQGYEWVLAMLAEIEEKASPIIRASNKYKYGF